MPTTKVNISGIDELDFPTGVSSATVAGGVATINLSGGAGSGTVTNTGTLNSGQLIKGNGGVDVTVGDLTGDVTTSGGTATTLANTAVTPGSYTNTNLTVDAKGRITAAANGSGAGGTVTTTGSPASGNLSKFSGATSITNADLTGDVTTSGTTATTLANTAVTPGSYTTANVTVDSKGRVTAASNGVGSAPAGTSVSTVSQSYTAAQRVTFDLNMAKTFASWKVTEATSKKFRLQLYSTSAARTADATRPFTIPLTMGAQHQCILDLYIDQLNDVTPFVLTPAIIGSNGDSVQVITIYAAVTNIDTSTQTIQVTISFVALES